jgi:hypothetical protein
MAALGVEPIVCMFLAAAGVMIIGIILYVAYAFFKKKRDRDNYSPGRVGRKRWR